MKNQNGITLIALVVTIVVLLILAGITITYVLSDNGIFSKATESQLAQEKAYVSDYVTSGNGLILIKSYDPSLSETYDATAAQTDMENSFPDGFTPDVESLTFENHKLGGSMTVEGSIGNHTVTFDGNGAFTVTSELK